MGSMIVEYDGVCDHNSRAQQQVVNFKTYKCLPWCGPECMADLPHECLCHDLATPHGGVQPEMTLPTGPSLLSMQSLFGGSHWC